MLTIKCPLTLLLQKGLGSYLAIHEDKCEQV